MKYRIVWKRKTKIFTEYLNLVGLKSCLDFLEKSFDCVLVSVTLNEN